MRKWRLFIGIFTGILAGVWIDRVGVHKVLTEKNNTIEKMRGNLLVLEEWLAMYRHGRRVTDVLRDRNVRTVAIYGMGILGSHLYQELDGSEIQVKYIMDRRPLKGIYHAEVCGAGAELKGVDAVIITLVYSFEEIKKEIRRSDEVRMISLRDLLDTEDRYSLSQME